MRKCTIVPMSLENKKSLKTIVFFFFFFFIEEHEKIIQNEDKT